MNTPDTEWSEETKALSEAWWNYWNYQGTPDRDFIQNWWLEKFSSRDTYWKERVRKEVEGMRVDCRHEEGHDKYREHCAIYGGTCKHQGWNQALDTLLDNLK